MKILLLGGTGYLGSRLDPVLVGRGHDVVSLGLHDGDLTRRGTAAILVEQHDPDLVVDLAAQPGRVFGEFDPSHTVQTNTVTAINVAQACAENDVRLCYVSTSEVYGDMMLQTDYVGSVPRPVREVHSGSGCMLNLYSLSKWWGEQSCQLYAPKDLLVIRPTMPYGPGMFTGRGRAALPTMIDNLLHNQIFTVHRDTYRSWCYVDDVVEGMADVIERGQGVYNVGRDDDLRSMEDLAALVCSTLDADPDLIVVGEHDETITPIKDISCARLRSLGWEPMVDIEGGIRLTADALRVAS